MIENGRMKGVKFRRARHYGGPMSPRQICLHDTAGALRPFSSVEWFEKSDKKVSAHFVVERDGAVTQMVETNRVAYHAGVSKWKGQTGLNSSSIGIEIVNPGKLDENGKADFGKVVAKPSEIEFKPTHEHGSHYWLPYTPAQIAAVKLICTLIVEEYPDCNEILTHWQISPGRKIDTNPLFPLREIRKSVLDPDPEEAAKVDEVVSAPVSAKPSATVDLVKEASKSTTARLSFAAILAWIEKQFGFLRDALPDAQAETETVANPLASLGGMLKVNMGGIIAGVTIAILLIVIYRHAQRKVELKNLKGE